MSNPLNDFTSFCVRHLGLLVILAFTVLTSLYWLGWDLSKVVYANEARVKATTVNLADHIKADDEYRRELRAAIQRIDQNMANTNAAIARMEGQMSNENHLR